MIAHSQERFSNRPLPVLLFGFMGNQANFILKVLILSAGISVLIKYGGPSIPVAATSANALIAVVTPSIVLAIALLWRIGKYRQSN